MRIRCNSYTCSVLLKNGLTLKLFYNDPSYGCEPQSGADSSELVRSQSCWFYLNEYVYEAPVGLA